MVVAQPGAAVTGRTVAQAEARGQGAFFVVQIDRPDGPTIAHPGGSVTIESGDSVVLVMRGSRVSAGTIFTAPAEPGRVGRNRLG